MDFGGAAAMRHGVDTGPKHLTLDDAPAPFKHRTGRWPWAGWSTRARLVAVVLLIDALAALISCGVIVLNARTAVRVETRASLATVESLVADTIRLSDTSNPDTLLQTLDLRFKVLRHTSASPCATPTGTRSGSRPCPTGPSARRRAGSPT